MALSSIVWFAIVFQVIDVSLGLLKSLDVQLYNKVNKMFNLKDITTRISLWVEKISHEIVAKRYQTTFHS